MSEKSHGRMFSGLYIPPESRSKLRRLLPPPTKLPTVSELLERAFQKARKELKR